MTTPTPRTDATCKAIVAMLEPMRGGSRVTAAEMKALEGLVTAFAKCSMDLERDLAARDAELAELRADCAKMMEGNAKQHARAIVAEQRAEAAEQERDSAVSWNHRVSVCEKHTAEIVDGPCVICELEAAERQRAAEQRVSKQFHDEMRAALASEREWKRKAEEAASELQMRRTPLNAPGDEELIRQSGIQLRHCSCSGGSGDEAHADDCPLWLDVLAARQWWRDRHVVAWSCSRETKGGNRCAQWCGHQQYCTAHTRDDIEIAAIAAKGEA